MESYASLLNYMFILQLPETQKCYVCETSYFNG